MARKGRADTITATTLDAAAPRRPKEGLVPESTGIFVSIVSGSNSGEYFNFSAGGVHLIGREGADIAIDDDKVSRKHAEIGLYGPGAYVLRDLASTNGTYVNGRRVQEKTKLEHGDIIRVGDTALRFDIINDALPVKGVLPY